MNEIKQTKEFLEIAEELLKNDESDQGKFYTFQQYEFLSPLFSKVEKELMEKIKQKIEKRIQDEEIMLEVYSYKQSNELRMYKGKKHIGNIDHKKKEFILFETQKEMDYLDNIWKERFSYNLENKEKEKQTLKQKEKKIQTKIKHLFAKDDKEAKYLKELNEKLDTLKNAQQYLPTYVEKQIKEFQLLKPLIEKMKELGFSYVEEEELVCCQLFNLFDGVGHREYMESVEYVPASYVFNVPLQYDKFALIKEKDMFNRHHWSHMRRSLNATEFLLPMFKDKQTEFIHVEGDGEEVEELFDEIKKGKRNTFTHEFDSSKLICKYKDFLYYVTFEGVIISTKEGINLILEEAKHQTCEIEKIIMEG